MWKTNPEQYAAFCDQNESILPVFYQPWWLNTVCTRGRWLPFVHQSGTSVWPVYIKQWGPIRKITLPPLTARLGPWPLPAPEQFQAEQILQQTQPVLAAVQHLSGEISDYTALAKSGFKLMAFDQYVIPADRKPDQVWAAMNELSRRNIRKSEAQLEYLPLANMDVLNRLIEKSLMRHGEKNPIPPTLTEQLYQQLIQRQQGGCWMAVDQQKQIHAAILLAWDHHTVYYLAGGLDDRIPQIGASRFLLWKSIELALQSGRALDFGGGFIPGVDAVYTSMGGIKKPWVRAEWRILSQLFHS